MYDQINEEHCTVIIIAVIKLACQSNWLSSHLYIWVKACLTHTLPVLTSLKVDFIHSRCKHLWCDEFRATPIFISSPVGTKKLSDSKYTHCGQLRFLHNCTWYYEYGRTQFLLNSRHQWKDLFDRDGEPCLRQGYPYLCSTHVLLGDQTSLPQ